MLGIVLGLKALKALKKTKMPASLKADIVVGKSRQYPLSKTHSVSDGGISREGDRA